MSARPGGSAAFHFVSRNAEDGTVIGMDVAVDSLATAYLRHASRERLYGYGADAQAFEAYRVRAARFQTVWLHSSSRRRRA